MARLAGMRDERGAVYVEFIIAFIPLFILFLGICQSALIATAEVVVRHAAYAGVRTAIVALDDDPKQWGDAPRGSLRKGQVSKVRGIDGVVSKLGIPKVAVDRAKNLFSDQMIDAFASQQGARMIPIRTAALLPLIPLAPNESLVVEPNSSVHGALSSATEHQLGFAVEYTKSSTLVTVHDDPQSQELAIDPIGNAAPVTVRVTYLFHCSIPIVRALMCRALPEGLGHGLSVTAVAYKTAAIFRKGARFKVLSAAATLPNQGAGYH